MNLKPCPCGQTPTVLLIQEELSPLPILKYARCTGNCCAEWEIEFRNDYKKGNESMARATQAWNDAPRGCSKKECQQRDLLTEKLGDRKSIDSPDSDLIYPND